MLPSLPDSVVILWGWRRGLLAFVAGALSALAFAPFDAVPLLWATIPVLIWLIDGAAAPAGSFVLARLLPAAAIGWWFGFGFFLAGLWWVGAAFLVDAARFGWLLPLAVIVLPAGLALFWAFGAALARLFWCDGWPRLLVFALAMSVAEWLRGHILTGFPWNAFGYALMPRPVFMQVDAVIGLWGMTLFAFLVFGAPTLLFAETRRERRGGRVAFAVLVLLVAADLGFGIHRLSGAADAIVPGVRLRLVQPNIAQTDKWRQGNAEAIMRRYVDLSRSATSPERNGVSSATLIVWPESAFPFLLTRTPQALTAIADLLPPGTALVTGAARAEPAGPGGADIGPIYNSIYVVDDTGQITGAYDKVHLVPFGEYLPFQTTLERLGLRQLTEVAGGFTAGRRHALLKAPGAAPPFSPLICYEAIFPGEAVPPGERPGFMLNVTNDAWYGDTPGPFQHFRQAVARSVEQGLPLVRAANDGISAIVDPYGRTVASLGLGLSGVVDGDLPAALPPTFYAEHGGPVIGGLFVAVLAFAGWGRFTLRR